MYQIELPKRVLEYTVNGAKHTDTSSTYVDGLGLAPGSRAELDRLITSHHNQLGYYERKWRNRRFAETDWMLVPDATYGGKALADSPELVDILTYRTALRDYNLTTDARPEKPTWFK